MTRDAGLLLIARVASAATTVVVLAILARLRGAEALGIAGIGLAAGAIAATASDLGTSSLLVRQAARDARAAGTYLGAGLLVRLVTVPILVAILALVAVAITPGDPLAVVLIAVGLLTQQAADLTRSVFLARQRMMVASLHGIVENLVWLGVVVVSLVAGATLAQTFAAALIVWIASLAVGLALSRVLAGVTPRLPERLAIPGILRQAGPFAAFAIIGIAYARLDPLLIGLLAQGPALITAGSYFAAARLIAAFEYLPEAVSRASFPELSRRAATPSGQVEPVLRSSARLLLALGLAIPAVVVPSSGLIMFTLFEVDAARDGWILGALACAVPIRYLGYLYGVTLTSSDAQGRRVAAVAAALVVVLLINLAGIPRVGVLAPVVATAVVSTLILAVYGRFVHVRFGTLGLDVGEALRLVASGLAALALGVLVVRVVSPLAASALALAFYGASLALAWGSGSRRPSGRGDRSTAGRRVLFVHGSDEAYGADRVLHMLATGLRDAGDSPLVLLPRDSPPGWLSGRLQADGIPFERVHLAVARRRYLGVQALPQMLRAIVTARSVIRAAAVRHDADIIHVNTSALVVGAVVGRPNGAKLVWHVHEIVVRPRLLAGLFRILPALTGDRVIAVSDAVKDHLLAPLWLRRRVATVRNGIPPRTPMPFPGLAGPGPLVAFVGRLNRWKGQEIFVAAAAKVASRFAEARFVVAGDPPPGEPEWAERLEAQVRRLELSSRVCRLGFVEDGAAVFDAAEIAVVPSIWPDPFPTVVLEAMRAGCAVVAADHGGAPEMIQHEATGLLVRPGDVDDTADAIGRLIDDPGLCRRLSAAARERAAVTFGVPAMLAGIKAVYTDLDR